MTDQRSPLHGNHEDADARFTDFGGWTMPVQFDSIQAEHEAVRETVGRFDVSHMGQVVVSGPDAAELTQRLTTNDLTRLEPGEACYAAITDEDGVMLEDTVVYRLPDSEEYLFVPNAGNDAAMVDRWERHREQWDLTATVKNETTSYGMIAVQGPEAVARVDDIADRTVADLDRFTAEWTDVAGGETFVSRTGYTGEDGLELLVPWDQTETVWASLEDCQRCGLGARDTLRLEVGLLLAGNEFDPEDNRRTPLEAGIGFAVDLDTKFVGRDALEGLEETGPAERLVGLRLLERGVPRSGYSITTPGGDEIGTVTSGTMSPTLDAPIGLGYVPVEYADAGTTLSVVVRDDPKKARVETLPFVETNQ